MPNPLTSFPNTPWRVNRKSSKTPCKAALAIVPQLRPGRTSQDLRRFLGWTTALSSVALVTIFLSASANPAHAGECVETDPANSPGDYLCSGPADSANDMHQNITGSSLSVTVADGFGIDTANHSSFIFIKRFTNFFNNFYVFNMRN